MKMPRLSLTQWLQALLVLALLLNALIHFTSPAYRYYENHFGDVERRMDEFERRVKVDFVPSLIAIATNRKDGVSGVVTNYIGSARGGLSFGRSSKGEETINGLQKVELQFAYLYDGSFYYNGFFYQVGDDFFDSRIVKITPEYFKTEVAMYCKPFKTSTLSNEVVKHD